MKTEFDNDIHGIALILRNNDLPRLAEKVKLLAEAAKAAREAMRGKDVEHVWVNYPTKPEKTLGQLLDEALS